MIKISLIQHLFIRSHNNYPYGGGGLVRIKLFIEPWIAKQHGTHQSIALLCHCLFAPLYSHLKLLREQCESLVFVGASSLIPLSSQSACSLLPQLYHLYSEIRCSHYQQPIPLLLAFIKLIGEELSHNSHRGYFSLSNKSVYFLHTTPSIPGWLTSCKKLTLPNSCPVHIPPCFYQGDQQLEPPYNGVALAIRDNYIVVVGR